MKIKTKAILNYLLLTTALSALAACDKNTGAILPGQQPDIDDNSLYIVATKQPFIDESETTTRTNTDFGSYTTSFANGDRIGIIGVRGGTVVPECNNLPLTYNSITHKWEGNNIYYTEGVTYIAYSPYKETVMNGKKSVQEIFNAFTIDSDQSTLAKFNANDLLASTSCTVDKEAKTLTITFEHRMAMLEIARLHGRAAGNYRYPIKNSSITNISAGGGNYISLPYRNSAEGESAPFRCFIKPVSAEMFQPAVRIADVDGTVKWERELDASDNFNATGGYRYKIVISVSRLITAGDYYYSDGSIFPGNITPVPGKDKGCIGVIFANGATGTSKGDNINDYSGSGLKGAIHGYVVALEYAGGGNQYMWDSRDYNVYLMHNTSTNSNDFKGYFNTKNIKNNGYSADNTPACWQACNYSPAAPGNSSGWFFPSSGQMKMLYETRGTLQSAFSKVGGSGFISGDHWTSSEHPLVTWDKARESVYTVRMNKDYNVDSARDKQAVKLYVRSVLAF